MSTCNRLDLQALGSQPILPKNLLDHCRINPKLCSITLVATKVGMILWSFVVLTWMREPIELV